MGNRVRERAAVAIARQGPHYRSWGADLGGSYLGGAVVTDGKPHPPQDPEFYTPTALVGGRLPHAWLDEGGTRQSTLDLIRNDRPTLMTPAAAESQWAAVAPADVAVVAIADPAICDLLWGEGTDHAFLVRPDHHIAAHLYLGDPTSLDAALTALRLTPTVHPSHQELTA